MIYSGRPILILPFSATTHQLMLNVLLIVLLIRESGRYSEEFNSCRVQFDLETRRQRWYYPNMNYHQLGNPMTVSTDLKGHAS